MQEARSVITDEYRDRFPSEVSKKTKTKTTRKFPYTNDDIEARCTALLESPDKRQVLRDKCRWTDETIKKYFIGYDKDEDKYWIPIKFESQYANIRKYSPTGMPKWSSTAGFGENKLFPEDNLEHNELFLMEGEKDCILANQLGLIAITTTTGAGAFTNEWKKHFVDKSVIICYDCDEAGRSGAQKVFNTIGHVAKCVKIIELPLDEPKNADFTDYILAGNSIQDFHALVQRTEPALPPSDSPVDIDDEVTDASLDRITQDLLFYKRTRMNVRVIGVESSPFVIPRHVCVECNKDNGNACYVCRVGDKEGKDTIVINETTPRILDLIECSTKDKRLIIRDVFDIPQCRKFRVKEKDHQAIHRVSIIPSIDEIQYDEETHNQSYVERELYFVGEALEANTDYEVETLAVPSPKDQSLVHLGYAVKPSDSSIEEFSMTPELKEGLGIFQCASETS